MFFLRVKFTLFQIKFNCP